MKKKKLTEPSSIRFKPINWVGYDVNSIARAWGNTQELCIEMAKAHIKKRPDRGPLEKWKIKKVGGSNE